MKKFSKSHKHILKFDNFLDKHHQEYEVPKHHFYLIDARHDNACDNNNNISIHVTF